ncbi:Olfactory receptor 4F6 [Microtus ochrogaster]|nr:Olfactory receptor 4F6 [Microtus ochrogaster]
MSEANHSVVSEFVFLGLSNSWTTQLFLFLFSCMFYVANVFGNFLIVLTVTSDPHLHSPMYFLLANLSIVNLVCSSSTAPKMIYDLLRRRKTISFGGCIT